MRPVCPGFRTVLARCLLGGAKLSFRAGQGHRGLELPAPIGMSWRTPCCSVHGESLASRANRSLISRYHACGGERHEASGGMERGKRFLPAGPASAAMARGFTHDELTIGCLRAQLMT